KPVRVDANEGWKTKEEALRRLEWLARDGHIQFVEQPMPDGTPVKDLEWLKDRSPLPIMADESCHFASDVPRCAEWAHSVNVKLVKSGGISSAFDALQAARKAGLKTMIGCMIESSVLSAPALIWLNWPITLTSTAMCLSRTIPIGVWLRKRELCLSKTHRQVLGCAWWREHNAGAPKA